MIIKRTIEGKNYEVDTENEDLMPQMHMGLFELAAELMDSYDEETVAYAAGASLFAKLYR